LVLAWCALITSGSWRARSQRAMLMTLNGP
jgi:hypothetical protein